MLKKDIGLCIRKLDYSETSQIVTFFTKSAGKIDAIAKGSKRPKSSFDGPIEIFSFGQLVFSESKTAKLATLTEFAPQPSFSGLRKNLLTLNSCLFVAELLNSFTEPYDPHPALFDASVQFLQDCQVSANDNQTLIFLILFQLTLFEQIGSKPVLGHCTNCKGDWPLKWRQIYFSTSANGLICADCEPSFVDKTRLSKEVVECLTDLKLLAKASAETLDEIEKILIFHFTELAGRPPKMTKYFLTR